jgi:hypothetical protein
MGLFSAYYLRWRVARGFLGAGIDFYQLSKINLHPEREGHIVPIRTQAVGRQLKPAFAYRVL